MNINIAMDEHVFVCGGTGCGKTFLCEVYLANVPSMVIKLDSKLEVFERQKKNKPIWQGLNDDDIDIIEHLEDLPNTTKERIIYAPVEEEMTKDYYNALAQWVYDKTNCILWIDELMSVCDNAFDLPLNFKRLLTRGRFINSVVWACTQRPSQIPALFMASSQHFFVFYLNLPQDRKKMSDVTGTEMYEILPKQQFYYTYLGSNTAIKTRLVYT